MFLCASHHSNLSFHTRREHSRVKHSMCASQLLADVAGYIVKFDLTRFFQCGEPAAQHVIVMRNHIHNSIVRLSRASTVEGKMACASFSTASRKSSSCKAW